MAVIFDLDQTLVDTKSLKLYRDNRKWQEIKFHLHETVPYSEILILISSLQETGIPMCVVTNTPSNYARMVLTYHKVPIFNLVSYHDTNYHKPHPDPMFKALQLMKCSANQTVAVGDDIKDLLSAKNAGIISVAALWGCDEKLSLNDLPADYIYNSPEEFTHFILKFHKLN